jgi:murein DD-endopeptidase MepM/ murein hydrolase activator NlpD
MKQKRYVLFFISAFLIFFPLYPETIHVLQRGETIYSIARAYGVSPAEVLKLNGMTESDAVKVQAGQRLKIPGADRTGSGTARNAGSGQYGEHRVSKNETFYSIAKRYNISVTELQDLNGFSPAYVLKEGEKIRVPVITASSAAQTVSAGQSKPAPASIQNSAKPAAGVKWPVAAKDISYMTGKLYGVMITGAPHEPVKSLTPGTVVSTGPFRGYGRVAIVQVSGGYLYVYGGCETLSVKEGDKVGPGTELGKLGIDTKSEKPSLFFMVYRGNNPIDPAKALRN